MIPITLEKNKIMIDFTKLTEEQKFNLHWILNFIEDRSLTNSEVKKHTNVKINNTVWLSIHDVSMLLIYLFSPSDELSAFREHIEKIGSKNFEEKLFKGELTKFADDNFHKDK